MALPFLSLSPSLPVPLPLPLPKDYDPDLQMPNLSRYDTPSSYRCSVSFCPLHVPLDSVSVS